MSIIRKMSKSTSPSEPLKAPKVSGLGKGTDGLWEFLTAREYPDGQKRELASLIVFWGHTGLTVCLSDKDNERSLFGVGDTLAEALEGLDEAAGCEDTVWRTQKAITGNSARKKS